MFTTTYSALQNALVSNKCTQVSFSYGDELVVHFGELSNHSHPRLRDLLKSKYQLHLGACDWVVNCCGEIIACSIGDDYLDAFTKEVVKELVGKKCVNCSFSNESLYILFESSCELEIILSEGDGLYSSLVTPSQIYAIKKQSFK